MIENGEYRIQKSLRRMIFPFEFIISIFLLVNSLRDMYIVQKLGNSHIETQLFDSNNIRTLLLGLILFYLKISQEGFRLNVVFAILSCINLAVLKVVQYYLKVLIVTQVLFLILYVLTILAYPVYILPDPQGQFPVGIKQMRIQDSSLTEVSVYYPCLLDKKDYSYALWSPINDYWNHIYDSMRLGKTRIPKIFFRIFTDFFTKILIKCSPNAPIIKQAKQKVIIFSHGLAAHRQSYSVFLTDLASKGYVVFSVTHLDEICPDEIVEALNKKQESALESIYFTIRHKQLKSRQEQTENVIFIIKNKEKMNTLFDMEVNLDLENIVLMGHSFGGATATQVAMENAKIKGVVCLDPWLFPQEDAFLKKQYNEPVLFITSETFDAKNRMYKLMEKYQNVFEAAGNKRDNKLIGMYLGSDHITQGDICFLIPKESEQFDIVTSNKHLLEITQAQRYLISEFLDKMIFSKPKDPKQTKEDILISLGLFMKKNYKKNSQFKLLFE